MSQDPGQAGIVETSYLTRQLSGCKIKVIRETGSKIIRALPIAAQAEIGNVKILRRSWNKDFLVELERFPEAKHDEQVDVLCGAFALIKDLIPYEVPRVRSL